MSAPPDDVVHRIHDRYLVEVVEGLKLCPFARKSREQGRVHRPVLRADGLNPTAHAAADVLIQTATQHADAEIVLLTFVGEDPRLATPATFDVLVREIRTIYDASDDAPRPFFMVGFHRDLGSFPEGEAPELTRDTLVPLLRRTPDPVIQCVDATTLERVRRQAQRTAHERMVAEMTAVNPALKAVAERSICPDSELSADIARANFESVAHGEGRAELERCLADIRRERDAQA